MDGWLIVTSFARISYNYFISAIWRIRHQTQGLCAVWRIIFLYLQVIKRTLDLRHRHICHMRIDLRCLAAA